METGCPPLGAVESVPFSCCDQESVSLGVVESVLPSRRDQESVSLGVVESAPPSRRDQESVSLGVVESVLPSRRDQESVSLGAVESIPPSRGALESAGPLLGLQCEQQKKSYKTLYSREIIIIIHDTSSITVHNCRGSGSAKYRSI